MSQAYKCDLCGNCVDNADNAKNEREVARVNGTIAGTSTDLFIKLGADVAHVCDACFYEIKVKAKAWINANVGD